METHTKEAFSNGLLTFEEAVQSLMDNCGYSRQQATRTVEDWRYDLYYDRKTA